MKFTVYVSIFIFFNCSFPLNDQSLVPVNRIGQFLLYGYRPVIILGDLRRRKPEMPPFGGCCNNHATGVLVVSVGYFQECFTTFHSEF